jgi:hypothetical protein
MVMARATSGQRWSCVAYQSGSNLPCNSLMAVFTKVATMANVVHRKQMAIGPNICPIPTDPANLWSVSPELHLDGVRNLRFAEKTSSS